MKHITDNPLFARYRNIAEKGMDKSTVERACDVCSELYRQGKYSDIAGKNGQWEKVFLCPKHQGYTR